MQKYKNLTLDEERALYGITDAEVVNCTFDGPADGESALKETRDILAKNCVFRLRYPLWHTRNTTLENCHMTDTCRAALWYDENVRIVSSQLGGIKALRECDKSTLENCQINSQEFGWFCRGLSMQNCTLESEYPFMHSQDMQFSQLKMKGKYSFQYVKNVRITDSVLDTKDAFWHGENIIVENSIVKGEYLGWYSKNLTFINCTIVGTQPLCYAKQLVLKNCTMQETDLAFEYSDVQADIYGSIVSVKNPASGIIQAESIGQLIQDEHQRPGSSCQVKTGQERNVF